MSLVEKVKGTAGDLYQQAKAKYSDSDAMQKAGKQAGQAAAQAGKASKQAGQAAGQMAGRLKDTPLAGRLKDLAGKSTSAVKGDRSKGTAHE